MTFPPDLPFGPRAEESERWYSSDVLVLDAVAHVPGGGEVEVRQIIATADFMDQVLLSREEIERAVNVSMAAGLLAGHEGRLCLTEAGRSLIGRIPAGCLRERTLWLQTNVPLTAAAPDPPWRLAEDAYDRAVGAYEHGFA